MIIINGMKWMDAEWIWRHTIYPLGTDLNARYDVSPPLSASTTPIRRIRCVFPLRANLCIAKLYDAFYRLSANVTYSFLWPASLPSAAAAGIKYKKSARIERRSAHTLPLQRKLTAPGEAAMQLL